MNSIGGFLSKGYNIPIYMVALPVVIGFLLWALRKNYYLRLAAALLSAAFNLVFALGIYICGEISVELPYAPFGFEFTFRAYGFSSFFLAFTAAVFLLIVLYSAANLRKHSDSGLYLLYLYLSLAMINGALLSDNLGFLLFFWEGLLSTLFGMLLIGNKEKPKTAVKALITSGLSALLLMLGVIITGTMAGTSNISEIERLPLSGAYLSGFLCLMLGALGKCGCMPFHSWIPDAAEDSPTVFMTSFPAALDKILGIYFAVRIVLDIYHFEPDNTIGIAVMILGAATMLCAGAMALVQKDIKRLLAYSSVSRTGFLILGIGTGSSAGILGGVLFLITSVIGYAGLFMISGIIEERTGITDLRKLGGLHKSMPVLMVCFLVLSLPLMGFPGLFTGNLILEATLKSNIVFYITALLGDFLTALALLNMWRSVFFGKQVVSEVREETPETAAGMSAPVAASSGPIVALSASVMASYAPVIALSLMSILLGIIDILPSDRLSEAVSGMTGLFANRSASPAVSATSVLVFLLAVCVHRFAANIADAIHDVPVLKSIYQASEKGQLDPYRWLMALIEGFSRLCTGIEHGVSWIYDTAVPGLVKQIGTGLHHFDNGSLSRYLSLAVAGTVLIGIVFLLVLVL